MWDIEADADVARSDRPRPRLIRRRFDRVSSYEPHDRSLRSEAAYLDGGQAVGSARKLRDGLIVVVLPWPWVLVAIVRGEGLLPGQRRNRIGRTVADLPADADFVVYPTITPPKRERLGARVRGRWPAAP